MKPTDRFGVRVLVSDGTLPKWATLIGTERESREIRQTLPRPAKEGDARLPLAAGGVSPRVKTHFSRLGQKASSGMEVMSLALSGADAWSGGVTAFHFLAFFRAFLGER